MPYFVTYEDVGNPPASQSFELADALARACRLLDEGKRNVVLTDGSHKSIGGEDLIACCHGNKEITADLKAVSVDEAPPT
jgi:hypothetical protein